MEYFGFHPSSRQGCDVHGRGISLWAGVLTMFIFIKASQKLVHNCYRTATINFSWKKKQGPSWWCGRQLRAVYVCTAYLILGTDHGLAQGARHWARILTIVPKALINNIPALVQIMAWRWPADKPLSAPIMVSLPMHKCVTRPQWVNHVELRNMIKISALIPNILAWKLALEVILY